MLGGRFSSRIGLLGIDIGTRSIKLLQLQQVSGAIDSLEVVGAGEVDQVCIEPAFPEQEAGEPAGAPGAALAQPPMNSALSSRLRATFASGRFTGRRCVVSLPRDDVRVQSVRLPKMPDAELRQAVGWEAAQRFGLNHEAMEVDFIRTGATLQSGENREEVIIVAVSHESIERRLSPIIEAGFRPVAVDTGFAALSRIFSRQYRREADRQNVRAIVEVGANGSTVLMLRGDQIAFCKPLEVSGRQFSEAVAEHLSMDIHAASELRLARMLAAAGGAALRDAPGGSAGGATSSHDPATERAVYEAVRPVLNELVKEVNLCLRYFGVTFRGKPPSQIILTGGDGIEPRLGDAIERGCKVAVAHDDQSNTLTGLAEGIQGICHPGMSRSTALHRSVSSGCWAVAAGLSLRGIAARSESFLGRMLIAAGAKDHQTSEQDVKGAA